MPWTLSSFLTMSTTRSGSAASSPPTGQNVPPSRKASMQSRMGCAGIFDCGVDALAARRVANHLRGRLAAADDDIGALAPEPVLLALMSRGGDHGGSGELGEPHGGRAHAA